MGVGILVGTGIGLWVLWLVLEGQMGPSSILSSFGHWFWAIPATAALGVIIGVPVYFLCRHRPESMGPLLVIALMTLPFHGCQAVAAVNSHFDADPGCILHAHLVRINTRGKGTPTYQYYLEGPEQREVTLGFSARLDVGSDLALARHRGALGLTWVQPQDRSRAVELCGGPH